MILKKDNVERIAETEAVIQKLKNQGFVPINTTAETEPEKIEMSLDDMTLTELKALAKEKGLEGVSALNKAELLEVMKEVV